MKDRYLTKPMLDDLKDRKMVFIGGPRQVGKTTLSRTFLADHFSHAVYYNWDNQADRKTLLRSEWPGNADLLILDEVHKFRKWKNYIKGEYDKHKDQFNIVVTGSSRLDVFRKGGDSLQGRYHYYRLHPFTLAELNNHTASCLPFTEPKMMTPSSGNTLDTLEHFGGFPEPFLKQNERFTRRWHNEKLDRMFREDIQDTTIVHDLSHMRLLSDMLPERVGSLLSTNALREDLEVSFKAVAHWLDVLETFYYHFRIYPFVSKSVRSLKKEPKLYLWDWSEVRDEALRFENMVACHLLKWVHYLYDYEGYKAGLYFLRDTNQKEVDFLVTVDQKPWFAVEVKMNDTTPAAPLRLFKEKWKIPFCYQVVRKTGVDVLSSGIRIISADRFLGGFV